MKHWKVLHDAQIQKIEEVVPILLKNRGISENEFKDFLSPDLKKINPQVVGIDSEQLQAAILKIKSAIDTNKAIVIYGDYDVDGICATAILWETIYAFYKNVHPYIPHRVNEGYGLSESGIKNIQKEIENVGLIITVDNGIVAYKSVEFANENKIEVIITDHHVPGEKLPQASAIVHTTKLCGTGVAYLLAQEIIKEFKSPKNKSHLELVALATVADLVPVTGFNRTFLKFGLDALRKTERVGLLALFSEAVINQEEIKSYQIGHMIAPRLNATGRISHAMDSLRLICTTDVERAKNLAKQLGEVNKQRQEFTIDSADEAIMQVKKTQEKLENLVFVSDSNYNQGVVGLIASRLTEEFYRPSIAVSVGDKVSKGSARSIPGVNIIELIRSCSEFLLEAGGHPMAAGFSLETLRLNSFKDAICKKAEEIDKKLFERSLRIDLELPFELINLELYDELNKLEPYGMDNPEPTFTTKGVSVVSLNKVGKNGDHLQMLLEKDGNTYKAIKFRDSGEQDIKQGSIINIAYNLGINTWNGKSKVELRIKDIT